MLRSRLAITVTTAAILDPGGIDGGEGGGGDGGGGGLGGEV